ncbi:MAG TPA: tetratricopeptide repeat protein [Terriglobia bacterium]|jgi:tetratricopeptide (TPR) repeat protein
MKRFVVLGAALLFMLVGAAFLLSLLNRPGKTDYQLAKGRSQLFTENYLAALQTLRDIPDSGKRGPEAHSYLGAAYLKLHLYKAAIKEFEEAVKDRPKESDPWIGLASSYIELGDASKAADEARRATEIEKRSGEAWIALGRAEWQEQSFDQAEKAALKARELEPDSPAVSDLLMHIYFDGAQPDKFKAELDRNPKVSKPVQDLAVRFFLAQSQFVRAYEYRIQADREDLERSVLEAQLALKRDPSKTEVIPQLVKNLVKVGRYQAAIDAAAGQAGAAPFDLELGKAYWMTGQTDQAIASFQRASAGLLHKLSAEVALAAITGDVKHWENAYRAERLEQDYFILARLEDLLPKADHLVRSFIFRYAGIYEPGLYTKAAEEAGKVLDDDPRNYDALLTIGTSYQRLGRISDATHYAEQARDLYPRSGEPVSRLASLALGASKPDPQRIIQLMEAAVNLEPNNATYLYNLGWMYDRLGETAKAADLYQRAIKASPLSFEAMNNLAIIYQDSGRAGQALPLLQQAMKTDPENEAVYANAANYYVRRHEMKEAQDNYDRALQLNPLNLTVLVERGRTYLDQGDTGTAIDNLSRALEVDPRAFDAYTLLSAAYEKMGHVKEAIAAGEEAQRIRPDSPEIKATLDRLNSRKDSK